MSIESEIDQHAYNEGLNEQIWDAQVDIEEEVRVATMLLKQGKDYHSGHDDFDYSIYAHQVIDDTAYIVDLITDGNLEELQDYVSESISSLIHDLKMTAVQCNERIEQEIRNPSY